MHLRFGLSPQPEYWDGAQAINRTTPRRARLLIVSGIKSYYIERRCSTEHQHIEPVPLLRDLKSSESARRLAVRLRQHGYTHLYYMPRATVGVVDSPLAAMTDAEAGRYVAWLRESTSFGFREGETLVYLLHPPGKRRPLGRVPLLEESAMKDVTEHRDGGGFARLGRLAPESSSFTMARGVRVLLDPSGNPGKALAPLSSAVRDPEASAIAWRALGFVLDRMGETQRAMACYRRSIEINPSDAEARFNAGQLLARLGLREQAYLALESAVRLAPDRRDFRAALLELIQRAR
jgi:tetratricopeptide (TPR) repeat protein